MTDRLIHRDQYTLIWDAEKVPMQIIDATRELYEFLPASLVYEVVTDDKQAGIGPIKLGKGEFISLHDITMLMHKRGFPIAGNRDINLSFATRGLGSALRHAYLAPRDLVFAVVGGTVGTVIVLWRNLF